MSNQGRPIQQAQSYRIQRSKTVKRNTQGVRIMRLDDTDSLAAVVPVPPGEKEDAETVPEGE